MSSNGSNLAKLFIWFDDRKPFLAKLTYGFVVFSYAFGLSLGVLNKHVFQAIGWKIDIDPYEFITAALIAHFGIFMAILVDIHKKVLPSEMWFGSHQDALPEIRSALNVCVKEGAPHICWIGVSLQSAWLALEDVLRKLEDGTVHKLNIVLLQSEPESLRKIEGEMEGIAEIAEGQMHYMQQRCRLLSDTLEKTGSTIVIGQYDYMPNIHGTLFNQSLLFLSNVRWTGKDLSELSVPREPFERFDARSDKGRYMIGLYNSWLEKGLANAEKNGKLYQFPQSKSAPGEGNDASSAARVAARLAAGSPARASAHPRHGAPGSHTS
jgi:hypothetical protein